MKDDYGYEIPETEDWIQEFLDKLIWGPLPWKQAAKKCAKKRDEALKGLREFIDFYNEERENWFTQEKFELRQRYQDAEATSSRRLELLDDACVMLIKIDLLRLDWTDNEMLGEHLDLRKLITRMREEFKDE